MPRRARACDIETSEDFGIQNTACGSMPVVGSRWVLDGPGHLTLRDTTSVEPATGEAVLEVVAAGICGSDLHGYGGVNARRPPGTVMGHEVVGRVGGTGATVAVWPIVACGT